MCEDSVRFYLESLASKEPVPGGGSASALSAALGAALLEMVSNFTVGKEKFKSVEGEISEILTKSTTARLRFTELIEEDKNAYLPVAKAYKLPKETDEEKAIRKQRINEAMEEAKKIPLEIKRLCESLLPHCEELVQKGNPLLVGDAHCARSLLEGAIKGTENFM